MSSPTAVETGSRREEIVARSAGLFRQRGYRETSIRDIAAALGIKSASLYYHFENKDAILFAIAYELMSDFVAEVTPQLQREAPPRTLIEGVVAAHLRFDVANFDRVIASTRERRALPAARQEPINALRKRHRHELERVVRAGAESGEFRASDIQLTTTALLDLLTGVKEWFSPRGRHSTDRLVRSYQHFAIALLEADR